MKVINPGRQQRGWAKEYQCTGEGNGGGGCGAVLLVEQDDVYSTSSSCYDGSVDHYTTFRCPSCSVETDINQSDLPSNFCPLSKRKWLQVHNLTSE